MTFDTYHWRGCEFGDRSLERARTSLASEVADEDSFLKLLRSGSIMAVGMALDHYAHGEATARLYGSNPYANYATEVLGRARAILSAPPSPKKMTGAARDGADHASALLVMLKLARAEDSDLIADSLRQATDVDVEVAATMAAGTALSRSAVLSKSLVNALSDIIFDSSRATDERLDALRAFNDVESPQAAEVVTRVLAEEDVVLQMHAALILATHHLSTHREMIEKLAATWPKDAPYPVEFVLEALHEGDGPGAG